LAAETLSGKVRNITTGRPSVGDQVILLRLGEGMEASATTHADTTGSFTLQVPVPGAQYIVRVMHQGVNYDQQVKTAAPLDIQVFDAAQKVSGISGSLGITQLESAGDTLQVAEMYAVNNLSSPAVTQASTHNFDFSLPENAKLESFQTKTSGGVWVNAQPKATGPQRYAVDFPLRPGETLFKYSYKVPYAAAITLRLQTAYPTRNYAIVHPPSMRFRSLRAGAFTSPGEVQGLLLEQVVSQSVVRDVPAFEISGAGSAPATAATAKAPAGELPAASVALPVPPARSSKANSDVNRNSSQFWAIAAGLAALFSSVALAFVRRKKRFSVSGALARPQAPPSPVDELKDQLFQLENERLHGVISIEHYHSSKQALNVSIQRALAEKENSTAVGKS